MKNFYNTNLSKLLKTVLTVAILLTGTFVARASHQAGADLTYTYIGNNQYIITYTFYRDCSGITAPTTEQLSYFSNSCNIGVTSPLTATLNGGNPQEISLNCPGVLTTCQGGSAPGFEQVVYTATITLATPCPDWTFYVSDCCRNTSTTIANSQSGNLYIDANLNNTTVNNTSPAFLNFPVAYVCIGQDNYYNPGAYDADGDSLVFSFINPRSGPNTSLGYASSYSILNPITSVPGVTINSRTGDIFMHPTQVEVGVLAIRILEYRNGVLIGAVMRDIQIYTTNCQNTLPVLSGVNGSNAYNVTSCAGGQLCFNVNSTDNDPSQQLTMTWNNGIPGATFTTSGGLNPTGTFCWTPGPNAARTQPYTFTVTVRDNACPSNGAQTYSFSILVSAMTINLTNSTTVACNGDNTGSASVTASGLAPLRYLWSTSATDTTQSISNLGAGSYNVSITDASGCVATRSFTITEPALLTAGVTAFGGGCAGTTTGFATAQGTGGTSPYSYEWDYNNETAQTISNLPSGTYTVIITDGHQCTATASGVVNSTVPPSFSIASTDATCTSDNGSVTVTITGGSGDYTYDWNPQVSFFETATGLAPGAYTVNVLDNVTGCTDTLHATVARVGSISPVLASTGTALCNGSTVELSTLAGNDFTYVWYEGSTVIPSSGNTLTVSAAGSYSVLVTDQNGCSGTTNVINITQTILSPVINASGVRVCNGSSVTLSTAANPDYIYEWYNGTTAIANSNSNTIGVSTAGSYSVIVTDQNGCTGASNVLPITFGSAVVPVITQSGTIGCLSNTVYTGWGPQGVTLDATTPGAVSYLWSTNETTASIVVSASGVYTVTITDANGCTAVSAPFTVTINTVDIRCGRNNRKFLLCHVPEGNLGNPQTICIDSSALNAHLTLHEYDCLGACHSTARIINEQGDDVAIYPNPSSDIFTVVCNFANYENTSVTVMDVSGRVIMTMPVSEQTFEVGNNLAPGIYYLHITGEEKDVTLRMIKTANK